MLKLSLAAIERDEARAQWQVAPDEPVWSGMEGTLLEPVQIEVEARPVGAGGVLVRGRVRAAAELSCRRCMAPVVVRVDEPLEVLYEPLAEEEAAELEGEVRPLPARGDELELADALREQLLLSIPEFVVCREDCRGFCARCGAELNRSACTCAPEPVSGPWEALKKLEFD